VKIIKVKGMSCEHCAMTVTKTLNEIDGVENAKVDLSKNEASYDETMPIDMDIIKQRIEKAGFEVIR
jgi:copper chaperone